MLINPLGDLAGSNCIDVLARAITAPNEKGGISEIGGRTRCLTRK